jgi:predicted GNAT family N-acyltransferase
MGKLQRRSIRARFNPTGLKGVETNSVEQREQVIPVIEKLTAIDPNDRAWACACISNLVCQDHKTRKLLLSHNLVSRLIERVSDTVLPVAVEAITALRNLTVSGGYQVCTAMYNKHVLTVMQPHVVTVSV